MAKTKFDIASAMKSEMRDPDTKAEKNADVPAATEEKIVAEPEKATPAKKSNKGGRPRKDDDRNIYVRCTVNETLKKKLGIICGEKKITENDYLYEALKKAINKDFEQALSALKDEGL